MGILGCFELRAIGAELSQQGTGNFHDETVRGSQHPWQRALLQLLPGIDHILFQVSWWFTQRLAGLRWLLRVALRVSLVRSLELCQLSGLLVPRHFSPEVEIQILWKREKGWGRVSGRGAVQRSDRPLPLPSQLDLSDCLHIAHFQACAELAQDGYEVAGEVVLVCVAQQDADCLAVQDRREGGIYCQSATLGDGGGG